MNKTTKILALLSTVVLLSGCGALANFQGRDRILKIVQNSSETETSSQSFNYEDYAKVLKTYVNDRGEVDYAKLKENRAALDRFNQSLAELNPATYSAWSEAEQIAFWVNAYNSLTLQAIIDRYPVDSIRNIPGVWKVLTFEVLGEPVTLDAIEHKILRKEFNEPRIHMSLVCAAVGCPHLRQEPYRGETLDAQLDEDTRTFLSIDRNFKIDADGGKVYLSSIFDWFGQDFEKTYGNTDKFSQFGEKEKSVLNFASNYLSKEQLAQLEQAEKVSYLDYDWSLNRQ